MTRLLLVGESWVSGATHYKGFDGFASTTFHTGADRFVAAMAAQDVAVTWMKAHEAPEGFPLDASGLADHDVVMLSDIGANSLLLHPEVWLRGGRVPNRLRLIEEWVLGGGGLIMVGGYLSFQGIDGRGRWHRTAVERALPVTCLPVDDRVEIPEGAEPLVAIPGHPLLAGVPEGMPYLLGVNEVVARDGAETVLALPEAQGGHPLLVAGRHGQGRSLAWTSDMSEHWLPPPFLAWPGYDVLFGNMVRWAAGRG